MAIKIAKVSELQEGKSLIVNGPEGLELALFKRGGSIYAYENSCPHMEGPVGEGDLQGTTLTCPWHGWQFDIETAECLNMPGEDLHSYPLRIEGDDIYLLI